MCKKIFLSIFILVALANCGFSPIYKNMNDLDFGVAIMEVSGDRDMNNLMKSNLNRYSNLNKNKIFKIRINTNYNKSIIAKDSTGKTTDYQIKVVSNFEMKFEELIKKINIEETFNFKKLDDLFEEKKYEQTIKQNISDIIVEKLISQLTRIQ